MVENSNSEKSIESLHTLIKLRYEEFQSKQNYLKIKIFKINTLQRQKILADQPHLMILIEKKNHKQQLEVIKKDVIFQNKLLESFSHELRTPLNCTILSLEMADKQSKNLPDVKYNIQAAIACSKLLMYQINNILDHAALQCNQFLIKNGYFDIQLLLSQIKIIYKNACEMKNIQLDYSINEFWIDNQILSDYNRIIQVLVSLIDNSIKFTQQYGYIHIEVQVYFEFEEYLMQIQVQDNGVGINNQKLIQINKKLQGNFDQDDIEINDIYVGLGLTISNKIVQRLDKFQRRPIIYDSIQNLKTTATFYITSFDQIKESIQNQTEKSPEEFDYKESLQSKMNLFNYIPKFKSDEQFSEKVNSEQKNEILIVDDVPFNHMALVQILKVKFQQIASQAFDGLEAIRLVKDRAKAQNQFKLILMDIEMPGLNGFQTTKQILKICNEYNQTTNIIMCSAYDSKQNLAEALNSGMIDVLTKPVKYNQLKSIIEKYLKSQQ